ncbi:MAG: OpgC domain-containing protein [Rhodospirillales bacterium]|nr:OpgC domain-containing protein [Rhodospirillales bacterium]
MLSLPRPGQSAGVPRLGRDPRIDLLRGFALLTIFVDHVPDNPLNLLTLRNFGFSDAAELFVILAGVSAMIAYGKGFERDGPRSGVRRVLMRCLRIYLFQVGLLLTTLAIVHLWRQNFGLEPVHLAPFFEQPVIAIAQALALHALPASLNILPLDVVLLAAFPLFYAGMRYAPAPTLGLSALMWLVANLDHRLNLTNWLDGQGWFFNPFAWQFLFALGALGAMLLRQGGGELPRQRWLVLASWTYLGVALLLAAPWTAWGLSDFRLLSFAPPDKTSLSPVRLLDILALVYLALSSGGLRRVADHPWARPVVACGRHSLEVFAFATLVALVFRLLFHSFGPLWPLQMAVNVVGLGALLTFGSWLEQRGRPVGRRASVAVG